MKIALDKETQMQNLHTVWETRLRIRKENQTRGLKFTTERGKNRAIADYLWLAAIEENYGNIEIEWFPVETKNGMIVLNCRLETGEIFIDEEG